ncbi:MAG: hypothetical protein WCO12_03485 [bacterium]
MKILLSRFVILSFFFICPSVLFAYTSSSIVNLEIVALDNSDKDSISDTMGNVKKFIEQYSLLKINYNIRTSTDTHTLTSWKCESDPNGCVALLSSDLSSGLKSQISGVKTLNGLGLFYKLNGRTPLQAGSTYGPSLGADSGSGKIAYFSIPTDVWWYNNDSYQGFSTRASQIVTHETLNIIQSTLQDVYGCTINYQPTPEDNSNAYLYEKDRLDLLNHTCGNDLVRVYAEIPPIVASTSSLVISTTSSNKNSGGEIGGVEHRSPVVGTTSTIVSDTVPLFNNKEVYRTYFIQKFFYFFKKFSSLYQILRDWIVR